VANEGPFTWAQIRDLDFYRAHQAQIHAMLRAGVLPAEGEGQTHDGGGSF
jgi:hypothetical protein